MDIPFAFNTRGYFLSTLLQKINLDKNSWVHLALVYQNKDRAV